MAKLRKIKRSPSYQLKRDTVAKDVKKGRSKISSYSSRVQKRVHGFGPHEKRKRKAIRKESRSEHGVKAERIGKHKDNWLLRPENASLRVR